MDPEIKHEIDEWVFSFALAAVFIWIFQVFYKPFSESNFLFKVLGGFSIVLLLLCIFLWTLCYFGTNPISGNVLLIPLAIYGLFATLSLVCKEKE